jgi:uncharacterized membrane protein YphA (DoxX/SURF4 family)
VTVLAVAVAAVCAVLAAAGTTKVTQPDGTAQVLDVLGVPGGTTSARALGVGEVVLGLAGLAAGGRWATSLVALAYAAAAGVVLAARRAGLGTCGCFGVRSPAPTTFHAVLDLGCAGVATLGAVVSVPPLADLVGELGPLATAGALGGTVLVAAGIVAAFLRPAG